MINIVIKTSDGFVKVFDENKERVLEYEGRYEEVKTRILQDAPEYTIFAYKNNRGHITYLIPREKW